MAMHLAQLASRALNAVAALSLAAGLIGFAATANAGVNPQPLSTGTCTGCNTGADEGSNCQYGGGCANSYHCSSCTCQGYEGAPGTSYRGCF